MFIREHEIARDLQLYTSYQNCRRISQGHRHIYANMSETEPDKEIVTFRVLTESDIQVYNLLNCTISDDLE